jgi:YesN/AraC family two-component response regulator
VYKLVAVDDEEDTRDTLCNCFPWEAVGFTIVKQANSGLEALHYVQEHEVDALLCDIRMPVMSGLELCKIIHERKLGIRVVLLSAYRDFEYARQAMQYGVSRYMVKPAKYDDIVQAFTQLKDELDAAGTPASRKPHDQGEPEELLVGADDPVISGIVDYVKQHYRTATLQQVSDVVNMNASYVSVYFKKKTGIHFSDYLLKARMEKAAELLLSSHLKSFEVSETVGYANPKNFIRSFKQYYGKTPGQFKNER